MAIILLAFVPVFALTGQEGKLFHPLAFTKTFAVLAATVIAVTLVPVLCTLLLGGRMHAEEDNPVMRGLGRLYRPALEWALGHGRATLAVAVLLFAGAAVLGSRIGSEFMPPLNEGDLLFMPIADPEHLARGEHPQRAAAERRPDAGPGGRGGRRQGRARRHLDGPLAAQHDGDHRPAAPARPSGGRA